ncbi:hypothetical protein CRN84_21640 [Budvicia aquatica]|uniref:Uncharacterized protein n=1 Tax=Budvicia aquatica TaxID=82979 RepID=A0A2C6DTE4_9GAMM|nr:hypothetical protein CRN84_21640 [Budvicia aquatica]
MLGKEQGWTYQYNNQNEINCMVSPGVQEAHYHYDSEANELNSTISIKQIYRLKAVQELHLTILLSNS